MTKIIDKLEENNLISFNFISLILSILFVLGYFYWDKNILIIVFYVFFEFINLLRLKYSKELLWLINKLIDHRYIATLILFLFCILFQLHGSSIGIYNDIILENSNEVSEIVGQPRLIRSDEWKVHTPYYFSQTYNDFQLESHQMSLSGQDMTVAYNTPVKNITELVKPQTWGYILFGNEVGLSWYWCFQLLLLIFGSFELSMILTKNNRLISFLGLMLIGFSPLLHWWFIPHITIVFAWGIILTVLGYYFFTAKSNIKKIFISISLAISVCAYVLALFPSCQVPLALISLVLLITLLIRDKDKITFQRKNFVHLLLIALFTIGILGYFIYTSKGGLDLVLDTVYPGQRFARGKDSTLYDLFSDLTVIFLPYKDITYLNNCEVSDFIHLGPLFLILFPFLLKKTAKKDLIVGKAILIMLLIQIIFMEFGFSELLARITLFSHINRMSISYGYLSTIFTIWGIYILSQNNKLWKNKWIILVSILYGIIYFTFLIKEQDVFLEYMPLYAYVIEIFTYIILVYLILNKRTILSVIIFSSMIVMATFTINPISSGTSAITDHNLYDEIESIVEEDNSNWVVLNDADMAGYLLASGAKVVNGVNYYPDYMKWKTIDPGSEHQQIYNRYAHINLSLTEDENHYETLAPDHISVHTKYEDLRKWNVKYIFSVGEIDDYLNNVDFILIYEDIKNSHFIYKLNYN